MIALIKVRKKCDFVIRTFFAHFHTFAHFKRAIEQTHFFALFKKATKCAIAHSHIFKERNNVRSHIFKERKNVRSHIRTFSKSENVRMCKCAIDQLLIQHKNDSCDTAVVQ